MKYSLMTIIPISTLLYSYLIFDSFGKDENIQIAVIPFIVFSFYSLVMILLLGFVFKKVQKSKEEMPSMSFIGNPLTKESFPVE
jgi:hypothetical protein